MVKDVLKVLLDVDFPVTKHFKLKEFFKSATADKYKIENVPNTYKRLTCVLKNILELGQYLEIIRGANHGKPVVITSGYRCVRLNDKVGGVMFSKHLDGAAVDITCVDMETLYDTIGWCQIKNITYEYYPEKKYIHIQLKEYAKPPQTNMPRAFYEGKLNENNRKEVEFNE